MRALIAGFAAWLASASIAAAAPCLPPDGVAEDPRIVVTPGSATVCVHTTADKPIEKCVAFSPKAKPKATRKPPVTPEKRVATVKRAAGKWSVCIAGTCKPVGKQLATALATMSKSDNPWTRATPNATDDGKVVAFGTELWLVASDTKLEPKAPKEYAEQGGGAALIRVRTVGNAIVAAWTDCAGPCGTSVLVDAKGENRGPRFGTGVVLQLDAQRLAVLSSEPDNELVVIDLATANQTARLPIDMGGVTLSTAARVDRNTVVVAYKAPENWVVAYYSAPAGKPITPGASHTIANCSP